MRILYVDLQYDYGDKNRGLNKIGQDGFIKSFQKLDHQLDTFYYDNYLNQVKLLQKDIVHKAETFQPDLIFFQTFTDQFEPETLDRLKSKFVTAAWFGDDSWRFDIYTKYLANHFTWCITTDKYSIPQYHKIGQKNVINSQWAAIDSHPIPEKKKQHEHEVSFVGGVSPYRKWFIDYLNKKGIKVSTFGIGWPNGPVSSKQMNEIFANSKINLNISNSESFDIRYLFSNPLPSIFNSSGNLKNKLRPIAAKAKEWKKIVFNDRGTKNYGQIKARSFEIPFFGGFQLTDYYPGLEDYFLLGEEIACYSTIDELNFLIRYYLENENLRENIAEKSHERAVTEHGYTNRIKSILKQIES